MEMLSCLKHVKRTSPCFKRPIAPCVIDVVIAGDRSGSMHTIEKASIRGIRQFIEQQINNYKNGSDIFLEVISFDQEDIIIFSDDIKNITDNTFIKIEKHMKPRGLTKLYDTIVSALCRQNERIKTKQNKMNTLMKKLDITPMCIFVLVTDGVDNKSTKNNSNDVYKMVKQFRQRGGHAYFIASEQDALFTGHCLGFDKRCSLQMSSTDLHTSEAFNSIRNVSQRVISSQSKSYFTRIERCKSSK